MAQSTPQPPAEPVPLRDLVALISRVDDLESTVARLQRELDALRAQVEARS